MDLHVAEIFISNRLDCLCDTVEFFPGVSDQDHIDTAEEQILVIFPDVVHQRFQIFLFYLLSVADFRCKVIVLISDPLLT